MNPVQVGKADCSADFDVYVDSTSNTAYFTNKALGSSTIRLWQFGDGSIATSENPTHKFSHPGYFTVGLNTYDPGTNCMDYKEELLLIGQSDIDCEADFFYNVDGKRLDCFNKSKGDNLSYFWWFGDGATKSNQEDTSVVYAEGGYYFVCLTVKTQEGIQNTRCKFIAVDPSPSENCLSDFIYTVDSATSTVNFTDKSLGNVNKWLWKFGDGEISWEQNPAHTYTEGGFIKVRLVSGDTTTGCISKTWKMLNVGQGNALKAGFGYEIDDLNFKAGGYPVDFVGVASGKPAKYSWDFGDGETNETNTSPTHEYDLPGEYLVCLTIEDQVTEQEDEVCETIVIEETTGINKRFGNQSGFMLNAFPNPFIDHTTIRYHLPVGSAIALALYDGNGRKIQDLGSTFKNAGNHELIFDGKHLSPGVYYLQLNADGQIKTKMIVKQ